MRSSWYLAPVHGLAEARGTLFPWVPVFLGCGIGIWFLLPDAPGVDARARAFVIFGLVEGAVHAHVLGGAMVSDGRFERALVDAVLCLMERDVVERKT